MINMTTAKYKFFDAVTTLFKAVPQVCEDTQLEADNGFFLGAGIYVTTEAAKHFLVNDYKRELVEKFGYDILAINKNTFYASFAESAETDQVTKICNILMYYFSVFVPEDLGVGYTAVIPPKDLQLPENDTPVKVTVITSISNKEISKRVTNLLKSGVALQEDSLQAILTIVKYLQLEIDVDSIQNKEFKVFLCRELNMVPVNPVEFLRYVIYLNIGSTLLIKDAMTIQRLKNNIGHDTKKYFELYFTKASEETLSSIFLRFKPLFLAMKKHKGMAPIINRLRKLAIKYHEAKGQEILDTITSSNVLDLEAIVNEFSNVTIFKKVALYNAITNKLAVPENRMFQIRNGKAFVKARGLQGKANIELLHNVQQLLEKSILENVQQNLRGKTVYIPTNITYTVPTSEKKLFNGIPFGSRINFSGSTIFGIYWQNIKYRGSESRVDLDLHVNSRKYHVGWNSYWNDDNIDNEDVIFSGDMVDAPIKKGGAAEAMYIDGKAEFADDIISLEVNRYSAAAEVPYKLFIGECHDKTQFVKAANSSYQNYENRKYIISAHEMSQCFNYTIDNDEQVIGFITDKGNGERAYYVTNMIFGRGIVANNGRQTLAGAQALVSVYDNSLTLDVLIEKAGGHVVREYTDEVDISLAPQSLAQDTILNLLFENNETTVVDDLAMSA